MQDEPRALCAVSEDRQWLVTHEDSSTLQFKLLKPSCFFVWQRDRSLRADLAYRVCDVVNDTGQSADAVLAAWLEGQ